MTSNPYDRMSCDDAHPSFAVYHPDGHSRQVEANRYLAGLKRQMQAEIERSLTESPQSALDATKAQAEALVGMEVYLPCCIEPHKVVEAEGHWHAVDKLTFYVRYSPHSLITLTFARPDEEEPS